MLTKLKGKRVEKGLSQKALSDKIGIALATYNRKENGKAMFTYEEILKILETLDCKFEDVFIK